MTLTIDTTTVPAGLLNIPGVVDPNLAVAPAPIKRTATPRTFLMCPPKYFDVVYEINPWMDLNVPVDTAAAMQQWETLKNTYLAHGHSVFTIEPQPGLPDMVYAANGGLIVDGQALAPRFTFGERAAEGRAYGRWFDAAARAGALGETGHYVGQATEFNEGEGDTLLIGDPHGPGRLLLCGTGFRTSVAAHHELAERLGLAERGVRVVTLELVDPRYYHLDTALTVLDDGAVTGRPLVAYLPAAFSPASQAVLGDLFPDAVIADDADAEVLGLNAVSDGLHVYLNGAATGMMAKLRARGFEPVGIDMTDILKGGGSVKCCTLFVRQS